MVAATWRSWTAIAVALLSSFQLGMAISILNPILEPLSRDLSFDKTIGGAVVTAMMYVGSIIGSLLAGPCEQLSGNYAHMWISVLFFVGGFLPVNMRDDKVCWGGRFNACVPALLLISRLVMGLASGLSAVIPPKFPPSSEIRGTVIASFQLCVAIGFFLSFVIGLPYEFASFESGFHWWRAMFLIVCFPAVFQFILFFISLPSFNKPAIKIRQELRRAIFDDLTQSPSNEDVSRPFIEEVEQTDNAAEAIVVGGAEEFQRKVGLFWRLVQRVKDWCALLSEKRNRRSIILAIGIPVTSEISGIVNVASYSTTIFKNAGFDKAIIGSAILGFGDIIGSGLSVIASDKMGRKTLAYFSYSGMAFSFAVVALGNLAPDSVSGPISVTSMFIFIVFFGIGSGPLSNAYPPEVVLPEIRGFVLGAGQACGSLAALSSSLVFPSMLESAGITASFFIMCGIILLCLLFSKVFMIETKKRELVEIYEAMTSF